MSLDLWIEPLGAVLAPTAVGGFALLGVLMGARRAKDAQIAAENERHRLSLEAEGVRHQNALELERERHAAAARRDLYTQIAGALMELGNAVGRFILGYATDRDTVAPELKSRTDEFAVINRAATLYASEEVARTANGLFSSALMMLTAGIRDAPFQTRAVEVDKYLREFDNAYEELIATMRRELGTST